jgi:hypothetical protein
MGKPFSNREYCYGLYDTLVFFYHEKIKKRDDAELPRDDDERPGVDDAEQSFPITLTPVAITESSVAVQSESSLLGAHGSSSNSSSSSRNAFDAITTATRIGTPKNVIEHTQLVSDFLLLWITSGGYNTSDVNMLDLTKYAGDKGLSDILKLQKLVQKIISVEEKALLTSVNRDQGKVMDLCNLIQARIHGQSLGKNKWEKGALDRGELLVYNETIEKEIARLELIVNPLRDTANHLCALFAVEKTDALQQDIDLNKAELTKQDLLLQAAKSKKIKLTRTTRASLGAISRRIGNLTSALGDNKWDAIIDDFVPKLTLVLRRPSILTLSTGSSSSSSSSSSNSSSIIISGGSSSSSSSSSSGNSSSTSSSST